MELLTSEGSDEAGDPDPAATAAPVALAPVPAADPRSCRPLYVPVRIGSAGGTQLRFARTPAGTRTAVAFTSRSLLAAAFGEQQPWVLLAESALRSLAEPLGAPLVTVDPRRTVAPCATGARVAPQGGRNGCVRRASAAELLPQREEGAGGPAKLSGVIPV